MTRAERQANLLRIKTDLLAVYGNYLQLDNAFNELEKSRLITRERKRAVESDLNGKLMYTARHAQMATITALLHILDPDNEIMPQSDTVNAPDGRGVPTAVMRGMQQGQG